MEGSSVTTSRPKIAVIGSLNIDMVVKAPRLPYKGETIIGTHFGIYPGGKGANQAVQAARLGATTHMIGKIGDDSFGQMALDSLRASGVHTDHVLVDAGSGTGSGCVLVDDAGDNLCVAVPRANTKNTAEDAESARAAIENADLLIAQLEVPLPFVSRAIDIAHQVGTRVLLNPAPARSLPDELLQKVYVIVPNASEAETLTGVKAVNAKSAMIAAARLLAMGPVLAVVTMGKLGAFLSSNQGEAHFPAFELEAVDTTAAGDAFCAALATALAESCPIDQAVVFANAAGALCATKMGAQPSLPIRGEVEAFLKEHHRQ
jgi:ribokinase